MMVTYLEDIQFVSPIRYNGAVLFDDLEVSEAKRLIHLVLG